MKYLFLGNIIKKQENQFIKSALKSTNVLIWLMTLTALAFIFNLVMKTSSYGLGIGFKSSINTFEMLLTPLFSELIWSSYPTTNLFHFIINLLVFYILLSFSFWISNKVIRYLSLILVTILIGGWYYLYIFINAAI